MSVCSLCYSSQLLESGWRTGGFRTQYFVGADQDKVAIFQGLSEGLPGLSLSRVYEVQQLALSELPPFYQEQVKANIDVASLDSARETVAELSEAAKRCAGPQRAASPRPKSTAGPKPSPTPSKKLSSVQPLTLGARHWAGGAELLIMRVVAPVTVVPRRRRGVELALDHLCAESDPGAYALVDINVMVSCRRPSPTCICTLLAGLTHIAVRWRIPYADPVIPPCVILPAGLRPGHDPPH